MINLKSLPAIFLISILLSGCKISSNEAYYAATDGVALLQDNTIATQNDGDTFTIRRLNNSAAYTVVIGSSQKELIAVPLEGHEGFYVVQETAVQYPTHAKYYYLAEFIDEKSFAFIDFYKSEVKKSRIRGIQTDVGFFGNINVEVSNPTALLSFYSHLINSGNFTREIITLDKPIDREPSHNPSNGTQQRLANDGQFYGRWLYRIEQDVITDETKEFLYGFPDGYDNPQESPVLRMVCYEAGSEFSMEASIFWKQNLVDVYPREDTKLARITSRFDHGTATEMGWALSQDQMSTHSVGKYIGDLDHLKNGIAGLLAIAALDMSWTPIGLHGRLKSSDRAVFRGYSNAGNDVTLAFDTSGYAEASRNFRPHCQ